MHDQAVAKRNFGLMEIAFRRLQRRVILKKIVDVKNFERNRTLCGDVLYTWRLNSNFSKHHRYMVQERNNSYLYRAFKSFKLNLNNQISKRKSNVSCFEKNLDLMSLLGKNRRI